ncbi:NADPH2:quinone reductase [Roseibium hamelinense]|uniref:NADPH2:quinone reductase n=1 Tax=Roseibium hamelinense TaxID=150831 RepID=A0A562SKU3_9HYPH|nr:NADPH:quinone oxidoreductase family protein [Roseibium hamelinense]MTI43288.1 NADPH:quinone oxidoreductase family protein [Roseibium hamelinense]TWI81782.1 NADPH2:quinone reductase [Roseibium hamelinense]
MRASLCQKLGPPETLTVQELPDPAPSASEILVRVKACALNFFDTLIIQGNYQFKPDLPFSPAAEFAGIIEATGSDVAQFKPGDRVMGYMKWGAARELVLASANDLIPLPDGVPFEIAAGLTVTYGTTLHAFRDRARLQPGETVAVLGASGGVGQAAVEIAKLMGARVIACASSLAKLSFAKKLGADELLDYSAVPLKETLKELTDGNGVDVVYDPVGGDLSEQALRATGWEGRYLVIGFASGDIPKIPLNIVMLKGCDVQGVFWGNAVSRDPGGHKANMELLLGWVAEGRIKPHIHGTYGLDDIPKALHELKDRKVKGKVIVTP